MKLGVLNKMSDSGKEKQPHELCKQDYSTSASRVADAANVRIKPDIAIENLKKLGALYKNVTSVRGFLTDLRLALGISDSDAELYFLMIYKKKKASILNCTSEGISPTRASQDIGDAKVQIFRDNAIICLKKIAVD